MLRIIFLCSCLLGITIHNRFASGACDLPYDELFPFHFAEIQDLTLECPPDWTRRGARCYMFYDAPLSNKDAQDVCSNKGANLVSISELGTNVFIGGLVENDEEYWIAQQSTPVNWLPEQPDLEFSECVSAVNDEGRQYPWKSTWCNQALGFVCERTACASDQFMCLDGGCVKDTYECDGESDCGDNSDEQNCPSRYSYHFVLGGSSDVVESPGYPSYYGNDQNVGWWLEGEVGEQLQIEFKNFKTEANHDILCIYSGSSTYDEDLEYVGCYSGDLNSNKPKTVISTNNYLYVHFVSDRDGPTSSTNRFQLEWSTTDIVSNSQMELDDATSELQSFTSPQYPEGYPGNIKLAWTIQAQSQWDLVTLLFREIHLADGDEVTVIDGNEPTGKVLAAFEGPLSWSEYPDFVTSSGRYLYISMDTESLDGAKGFEFFYKSGCTLELFNNWGTIVSPGMDYPESLDEGGRHYAKLQTCTYHLKLPEESLNNNLSLTVDFENFNLQDAGDSLEVFDASDASGAADLTCSFSDSTGCQSPITSPTGEMFLKFKTDEQNGDGDFGFRIKYSVGCKDPEFDENTIVPPDTDFHYRTTFNVTSAVGYYFAQEEFGQCGISPIVEGTPVELECMFKGRWNVDRLPVTRAVYCVDIPEVANGFISSFTNAEFGGRVEYECFEGFTLNRPENNGSVCQNDGAWSEAPACEAAQCPAVTVTNDTTRTMVIENGDGTGYGSVVRFECNDGYQLTAGDPVILCLSNGTWSGPYLDEEVVCSAKTCVKPPMINGVLDEGDGGLVDFEGTVEAECFGGYVINNTILTSKEIACLANETFEELPICVNEDECDVDDPCVAPAECVDTEGSYKCLCPPGFTKASDTTCAQINECEGSHGCYNSDECTDTIGSYTCSCPASEGLVLFTEDGLNGFYIRNGESGDKEGDMYRVNHTCIRNICPDPLGGTGEFGNGTMMVHNKNYFYSGDTVQFFCHLGYGIEGVPLNEGPEQKEISCTNSGVWSDDIPKCVPVECEPLESQSDWMVSRRNSPTFPGYAPSEKVPYGGVVVMSCSVDGRVPETFNRTRTCLYDVEIGQYSIIGDPLDCGVIDCGSLETIPGLSDGSYPVAEDDETTYLSTFTFVCKAGFTKEGNSSIDADTVTCQADGHWDLNDLRCVGESCGYPGRPSDGYLTITSFEDGQIGVYTCERPGYTPNPSNVTCVRDDGAMKWLTDAGDFNPASILCEDTEPPVFNNCPQEDVYVSRYGFVDLVPDVSDNSGSVLEMSLVPPLNQPITAPVPMTWITRDHNGNNAQCDFQVQVINENPPEFTGGCPVSKVYEMADRTMDITVDVHGEFDVTVTGFEDLNATSIFSPTTFTVNEASLYKTQVLTVTAHEVGWESNTATCTFSVMVVPSLCATWAFMDKAPLNGEITLLNDTRATVSCDPDHTFSTIDDTELLYVCDEGGEFVNDQFGAYVPECVSPTDADFKQQITLEYESGAVIPNDARQEYVDHVVNTLIPEAEAFALAVEENVPECYKEGRDTTVNVEIADMDADVTFTLTKLSITYTITYVAQNNGFLDLCRSFYKIYFENVGSPSNFPLLRIGLDGRDELVASAAEVLLDAYSCPVGQALKIFEDADNLLLSSCTPCAAGTYFNNSTQNCTKCDMGMYQDEAGQTSCKDCPNGTYTYSDGAASMDLCYDECPSPLRSDTRLGPCSACPVGEYWTDAATCTTCTSAVTRTLGPQGPADIEGCYAQCELGYFSYDGFGPDCRPCPIGTYANAVESTECAPCGTGMTTAEIAANDTTLCFSPTIEDCTSYCVNASGCSPLNGVIICTCSSGFTGELCDTEINECSSSPCFYGGTCVDEVNGYTCICPSIPKVQIIEHTGKQVSDGMTDGVATGDNTAELCKQACVDDSACAGTVFLTDLNQCFRYTEIVELTNDNDAILYERFLNESQVFGGDRCEDEPDDCPGPSEPGFCENQGGCQDLVGDYECLCLTNLEFSGDTCSESAPLCGDDTCMNNGDCVDVSPIYFICNCQPGYTGTTCETNIDDCDPDLCLNGGDCTDEVNGFDCACPEGFSGDRCEIRPSDLCDGNSCGTKGRCVEDYRESSPLCVCESGYTSDTYWTLWFDVDDSDSDVDGGDFESVDAHGAVCGEDEILGAECRVVGTGTSSDTQGQELHVACSPEGLVCYNSNNTEDCVDYEVRYECQVGGEQCRDINECGMYQCQNEATCEDGDDDYSCECVTGYEGFNCQHDIDECENSPCKNGDCNQFINYFNCTCFPGFEGSTCATDIDDCASNPCDEIGSIECQDRMDDFYCECQPGYTGKNCSENINECNSSPCYHNGDCVDGVDEYTCDCIPGWTGDRCENMIEYCPDVDCQNGGECIEVFGGYFCSCTPGYSGDVCSLGPELCEVADPCLNGGVCNVNDEGEVECMCPDEYTGDGCQCQKDYCGEEPICQNDAECSVSELGTYNCDCLPGFTGINCETDIDDCEDISCGSSECLDGIGVAFCDCGYGKTGAECDKDVYRQFDMEFTQKGETCSLQPFLLNTTSFTVALWVRVVSTMDVEGVIFTVYAAESETSNHKGIPILELTIDGVNVAFDNDDVEFDLSKDISDGSWYHVVITADETREDEEFKVYVDAASTPYGADLSLLPPYALMCLGPETFAGELSLVQGWNYALSDIEVSNLFSNGVNNVDGTDDFQNRPILDWSWGYYAPGLGVIRHSETDRAQKICKLGEKPRTDNTGATYCDVVADKHAPTSMCPSDIDPILPADGGRFGTFEGLYNLIDWFEGGNMQINTKNDEVFGIGHHAIVGTSVDSVGNRAFCLFDVFVRLKDCTHVLPDDAVCNAADGCDLTCSNGQRHLQDYPDNLHCGPSGVYNTLTPLAKYRLPECGVTQVSTKKTLTFGFTYQASLTITEGILENIRNFFLLKFGQFDNTVDDAFCTVDDCGNLEVKVLNVAEEGQATVEVVAEQVTADISGVDVEDKLRQAVLLDGAFTLENIGTGATVITETYYIDSVVYCGDNHQAVDDVCVECPKGTFFNAVNKMCDPCPIGQYQEDPGMTECELCDEGSTTETVGSTDAADCIAICEPGHKYSDEEAGCVECGLGFYQLDAGETCCLACDIGKTTNTNTSVSEDDCFDTCQDGHELRPDGTCLPCPIGTYRKQDVQQSKCVQCPTNFITEEEGGVTEDDCTVRVCPAGQFVVGVECEVCPENTYRSLEMENCTACPEQTRTEGPEQVSLDKCLFFCPAGKFVDNSTGVPECTLCPRDQFKVGDTYDTECQDCPDSTPRTAGPGAVSQDECRFGNCVAGEYVDPEDHQSCLKCPLDTFQENPDPVFNMDNCTDCEDGFGTKVDGANSSAMCLPFCESGHELVDGECEPCARGFYKDNSVSDLAKFDLCTECDDGVITPEESSVGVDECSQGDCVAGEYASGIDCLPCPKGKYSDEKWQTECKDCEDPESTTKEEGANSAALCNVYPNRTKFVFKLRIKGDWLPAYKNRNNSGLVAIINRLIAILLEFLFRLVSFRGELTAPSVTEGSLLVLLEAVFDNDANAYDQLTALFKNETLLAMLAADGLNLLEDAVVLVAPPECKMGEFLNNDGVCKACPVGHYQPNNNTALCLPCPDGETTAGPGTVTEDECIRECDAGTQDDNAGACQECPDNTASMGGIAACTECAEGEVTYEDKSYCGEACDPGEFSQVNGITDLGECVACPVGTYSTEENAMACEECEEGLSTLREGASNQSQCMNPCQLNDNYCNNGECSYEDDGPVCTCDENYIGDLCNQRLDPSENKDNNLAIIIGATIGGVVALIVLILLIAWCVRASSTTKPAREKPLDYPARPMMYPAAMGSGYAASSMPGYYPSPSYYPTYGGQSVIADPTQMSQNYDNSGYMFYDEQSEAAPAGSSNPYTMQSYFQR